MYDTDDNTTTDTTDTERLAALQAEVTTLTSQRDYWRDSHTSANRRMTDFTNDVQALAATQADDDENLLNSDQWATLFDRWGITDPRRVEVTITVSATMTQTAEVTITLTGVKRSEVDDIDVGIYDVTDLSDRRNWSQYVSVGVDYEDLTVDISDSEYSNEVDDVTVSIDGD